MNLSKFFRALELTSTATKSEIKSAYYRLSQVYHPDKNNNCPKATHRFQTINEAYEELMKLPIKTSSVPNWHEYAKPNPKYTQYERDYTQNETKKYNKKKYKSRSPPKNKGSDVAIKRFREIKEAYEVLGNHGKKRKYDRVFSPSSAAFSPQPRTGNEIVAQDTDAYSRHMARYSTPMGDRPAAEAMDKSLSDRSSAKFREKQNWHAQRNELKEDMEEYERDTKNLTIAAALVLIIAAIAMFLRNRNEKRYERMVRENKEKKSK